MSKLSNHNNSNIRSKSALGLNKKKPLYPNDTKIQEKSTVENLHSQKEATNYNLVKPMTAKAPIKIPKIKLDGSPKEVEENEVSTDHNQNEEKSNNIVNVIFYNKVIGSKQSQKKSQPKDINNSQKDNSQKDLQKKMVEYRYNLNQELLKILAEEREKEDNREKVLAKANREEREKYEKIFGMERANASERILKFNE